MEDKSAYPYITDFKKEPFKSFALIKSKDIQSFFLAQYDKVKDFVKKFEQGKLFERHFTLEHLYWFLLLKKFLKADYDENTQAYYEYIKKCEVEILEKDQIGFKMQPTTEGLPDIWSTYYAFSCLNLLGYLKEYILSKVEIDLLRKLKNFVYDHKRNEKFLHCLEKDCEIRKKPHR